MTTKPPFANTTLRDIWAEKWCAHCFEPAQVAQRDHGTGAGCPIMLEAMVYDRKPKAWDRNRNATIDNTYTCNGFRRQPDSVRRVRAEDETLELFDVEPADGPSFVPVDGWPDKTAFVAEKIARARKGDHA